MVRSLGVMPSRRLAWPMVWGRNFSRLWRASLRSSVMRVKSKAVGMVLSSRVVHAGGGFFFALDVAGVFGFDFDLGGDER